MNDTNLTDLNGNVPMSLYRFYLVCYDIENNKLRKQFYGNLKDLGLMPIQKSVFWGQLNKAEFKSLQRLAKGKLDPKTDKCFWMATDLTVAQLRKGVGYQLLNYVSADGYYCL